PLNGRGGQTCIDHAIGIAVDRGGTGISGVGVGTPPAQDQTVFRGTGLRDLGRDFLVAGPAATGNDLSVVANGIFHELLITDVPSEGQGWEIPIFPVLSEFGRSIRPKSCR